MANDLPLDDNGLVHRIQTGTPSEAAAAFEQLVARHSSRLFIHLTHKGLSSDEQKDVANEIWLRVWRKISKFEYRGIDLFPWMRKISDYVVREYNRSRYCQRTHEMLGGADDIAASEEILSLHDPDPPVYETLSIQEFRDVVQQILGDAPEDYKNVIEARVLEGLQPDEIGELYGWSRPKVDTTFFRAVGWLRKKFLERYGPQDWLG